MGGGGVGKSSLTIRFVQGHMVQGYDPTIEDTFRKQVTVDAEPVIMQILDTAGQEQYSAMRDGWIRTSDCFIFVFSVTDRSSFNEIDEYYEQMLRVKDATRGDVPLVLLANKIDLVDERVVSEAEAAAKATEMGCTLVQTSALSEHGVVDGFEEAVRAAKHGPQRKVEHATERRQRMLKCSIL